MKKVILLTALIAASLVSMSQTTKLDTGKKKPEIPTYKADPEKQYNIGLTQQQIAILTKSPDDWKVIEWSNQMSGEQIQQAKAFADDTRKKVIAQFNSLYIEDKKKFDKAVADSLKKTPPIKK